MNTDALRGLVERLQRIAKEVQRLAFELPPPNLVTPRLVMTAQGLEAAAHELSALLASPAQGEAVAYTLPDRYCGPFGMSLDGDKRTWLITDTGPMACVARCHNREDAEFITRTLNGYAHPAPQVSEPVATPSGQAAHDALAGHREAMARARDAVRLTQGYFATLESSPSGNNDALSPNGNTVATPSGGVDERKEE